MGGNGLHQLAEWLRDLPEGYVITLNEAVTKINLSRTSVSALLARASREPAWGLRKLGAGTYRFGKLNGAEPGPPRAAPPPEDPAAPSLGFADEVTVKIIRELDPGRFLCSGDAGALYVLRRLETS